MGEIDLKQELALKAAASMEQDSQETPVKLTKEMSIPDIVKALGPELKKALPSVLTPERFTRIALSAINNTPQLAKCTPMSFISALLGAAQLGLEVNSVLGQAYLVPYKNKGVLECQLILGYKGLLDLAYRNGQIQTIQARTVYTEDLFEYEYGLNQKLVHKPAYGDRGEPTYFYALYKTTNGGFGFSVMSKPEIDVFAATYSKGLGTSFSPWKTNYEAMALKTVLRRCLRYMPLKADVSRNLAVDGTIKTSISANMDEIVNELSYEEVA